VWDRYGRGGVVLYGRLINYEVKHKPRADGHRQGTGRKHRGRGTLDRDRSGGARLAGAAFHRQDRAAGGPGIGNHP